MRGKKTIKEEFLLPFFQNKVFLMALVAKIIRNVWNHIQLITYFGILADKKKKEKP